MRSSGFRTIAFLVSMVALVATAAACGGGQAAGPTAGPSGGAAATKAPAATAPAAATQPMAAATTAPTKAPEATKPSAGGSTPAAAAAPAPTLTKQYKLSLATGGTAGTYFPFGGAMASLWSRDIPNVEITAETTGASVENMRLLGSGQVELALVQNDIADYANSGTQMFKDKSISNIRAIAALYPELLQWVVNPDINTLDGLKGKNFVVGPAGSGTEINTREVLEANGMNFNSLGKATYLSFAEAANAYKDRQVDGFAITGGVPTSAITDVATVRDIGILPIDGQAAQNVMNQYKFFVQSTIPANAYKGVSKDVNTVAVQAILVAQQELDPDVVYWITKTLVEKRADLAQAHAKGKEISPDKVTKGITIPFHEGAKRYYQQAGIQVPQ